MKARIIKTLVAKDVILFFRDKFFAFISIIAIVMYVVTYFVMPKAVDETIKIGLYAPQLSPIFNIEEEGLIVRNFSSEDELKEAITAKEYLLGISIPGNITDSLHSAATPQLFVYHTSDLPDDIKEMYTIFMNEMIYNMLGDRIALQVNEVMLGADMAGKQIPYRDRLLPLFAFLILIAETFGLANLITYEVEHETAQALLTTPMTVVDLFIGKGITGVSLAFVQALFLLLVTGSLAENAVLIATTLLLGAIMVTGVAFVIASISRDIMSVVAWGTLVIIISMIPALSTILPGLASGWIKIIPSFFIADTLYRAINFDVGWSGNLHNIIFLIGFDLLFVSLGIITLKRKLA